MPLCAMGPLGTKKVGQTGMSERGEKRREECVEDLKTHHFFHSVLNATQSSSLGPSTASYRLSTTKTFLFQIVLLFWMVTISRQLAGQLKGGKSGPNQSCSNPVPSASRIRKEAA
jgi:hypothetical protein